MLASRAAILLGCLAALAACTNGPATRKGASGECEVAIFPASGGSTARAIAVSQAGAILLVGDFAGTLEAVPRTVDSAGGRDAYAMLIGEDVKARWLVQLGGAGEDFGRAAVFTQSSDALVGGAQSGQAFVARLAGSDGHTLWSTLLPALGDAAVNGLALDDRGGVRVTGQAAAQGREQAFVARLEVQSGAVLEAQILASPGDGAGRAIAVAASGGAIVVGAIGGGLATGTRAFESARLSLASLGGRDAFMAAFDPPGDSAGAAPADPSRALAADASHVGQADPRWLKSFGDNSDDQFASATMLLDGDLLAAGSTQAPVYGTARAPASTANDRATVARVDPDGNLRWQRTSSGARASLHATTADADGHLWVGGEVEGPIDVGIKHVDPQKADAALLIGFSPLGDPMTARTCSAGVHQHIDALAMFAGVPAAAGSLDRGDVTAAFLWLAGNPKPQRSNQQRGRGRRGGQSGIPGGNH